MINREKQSSNDDAISPVIGVLILLLITIAIGGVLAEYTIGLSELLEEPMQASVIVEEEYERIDGDEVVEVTIVLSDIGDNTDRVVINADDPYDEGFVQIPVLEEVGDAETMRVNRGSGITVIAEDRTTEEQRVIRRISR